MGEGWSGGVSLRESFQLFPHDIGLAGGRRSVPHWEAIPTFKARFSDTDVLQQLDLIDAKRVFRAGGVTTPDLMLELIGRLRGRELANQVANALVHTRVHARRPAIDR